MEIWNNYKIYFYDRTISAQYPITVSQPNINALCAWLNGHTRLFGIEVVTGYLLDKYGGYLDEVEFLPQEIVNQHFFTNYKDRLIAYSNFVEGGV